MQAAKFDGIGPMKDSLRKSPCVISIGGSKISTAVGGMAGAFEVSSRQRIC